MKRYSKYGLIGALFVGSSIGLVNAQTVLAPSHIIAGDLDVGLTGTNGNLTVKGDTGNTAPPSLKITGDGGVVFLGASGTGQIPVTGAGTRMMWYPKKSAFRAGTVDGAQWDDANIGSGSVAFGQSTTAKGYNSVSIGESSSAYGSYSLAFGLAANANANYSLAFGHTAYASASYAIAHGGSAMASGVDSLSSGYLSAATGLSSSARGTSAIAVGDYSTAIGFNLFSIAAYSVAIGRSCLRNGNTTTWVNSDPLFVVGNGTGVVSDPPNVRYRNAFTVYKDGRIKMDRQGDILMGDFGNP